MHAVSLKLAFMSRDLSSPLGLGNISLGEALGQMPRVCTSEVRVGIPRSSYVPRRPLVFVLSLNIDGGPTLCQALQRHL